MNEQDKTITLDEIDAMLTAKVAEDKKRGPANPQNHKRDKTLDSAKALKGFIRFLVTSGTKPKSERPSEAKIAFVRKQINRTLANLSPDQRQRVAKMARTGEYK